MPHLMWEKNIFVQIWHQLQSVKKLACGKNIYKSLKLWIRSTHTIDGKFCAHYFSLFRSNREISRENFSCEWRKKMLKYCYTWFNPPKEQLDSTYFPIKNPEEKENFESIRFEIKCFQPPTGIDMVWPPNNQTQKWKHCIVHVGEVKGPKDCIV